MRPTVAAGILALALGQTVVAQHSNAYVFAGGSTIPGRTIFTHWHGNYLHMGGGAEAGMGERFTPGGEAGALLSTAASFRRNALVASFGPGFHLFTRSDRKLDPFIAGGVSLLAGSGVGGMFYYGGGVNYWFSSRLGLRVEFRDHVWSPEGTAIHFVGARIGLSIR